MKKKILNMYGFSKMSIVLLSLVAVVHAAETSATFLAMPATGGIDSTGGSDNYYDSLAPFQCSLSGKDMWMVIFFLIHFFDKCIFQFLVSI